MDTGDLLLVDGLYKSFGGLVAVHDYRLRLPAGQVLGLIGPNGAGKTTVINILSGLETPGSGSLYFDGIAIGGKPAQEVARLGLARTFQNLRLFRDYSVVDNVCVALLKRRHYGVFGAITGRSAFTAGQRRLQERAQQLLADVHLLEDAYAPASSLPYGKQRRLEIARALALEPKLLLLDEPAAGMVQEEQEQLASLLRRLRQNGLTLLVVDHNVRFLLSVADRVQVMHHGELIAEGDPDAVTRDPAVIEAYLGQEVREGQPGAQA